MVSWIIRTGHRFGFTSSETSVILFLSVAAMTGGILRMSGFDRTAGRVGASYAAHDSIFAARATAVFPDSCGAPTPESLSGIRDAAEKRSTKPPPSGIVNLNRATERDLLCLPGIGPSTAGRIVAYRETHGPFSSIEDIMNVSSIGEKKFEKIKPYLSVSK